MNIDRRSFLKNTSLTTAGMLFMPSILQAEGIFSTQNLTNNNFFPIPLTLISVIEDSCMLTFMSGMLTEDMQNAVLSDIHVRPPGNKGRMAGVLPPMDKRLIELLEKLKNNKEADRYHAKLSVAAGWAIKNAVHGTFREFFDGKTTQDAAEAGIHMDATVLGNLSVPVHNPTRASAQEMEELLNIIVPRAITRTHTIKPDSDDGIGWVNRMTEKRKVMKEKFGYYARAIVNPDKSYLPENFYQYDDPIISAARDLQNAKDLKKNDVVMQLTNKSLPGSMYGMAVRKSTDNILAINDYMSKRRNVRQLEKQILS